MNQALQAKLKTLPRTPGVYFHKSASGEVIYVGKAAVLKNRVRQYFQDSRGRDNKTMALVAEILILIGLKPRARLMRCFWKAR